MLVIWLQISFRPFQNLGKLKLKERKGKGVAANVKILSLKSDN